MAVDRNTIVTLHKKVDSNSCIAKKLHIKSETVWKVVKKFKETGETCNRRGQGRKWSPNNASSEKYEGKDEKEFTLSYCKNGCRSRNQLNFNALNPQRRPQNLSLQNAEKAWTFNHSWMYETWQMQRHSESYEDGMVPYWVFTDEKKFDVQQCQNHQNNSIWSRDGLV